MRRSDSQALISTGADNHFIFVRINNQKLCEINFVFLRDVSKVVLNRQVALDHKTTPLIPI